ncbi:peptidylprolyl isomerase [Algoriphagus sp. NF]|uniref:peptidylprolyl isomerase n=1 Tax=Algoriphagus sp. NF TaxID=2992756 RepID=UPI00237BCC01|nr:peptidylprolyl isomerase [Algoriphagus sp. NF]MDE0561787.1 peptidylprolyl isomerase [Algoriphagus sp. NF]
MNKLLIILVLIFESYQTCLAQDRPQVEIQTSKGIIVVELFNETPQHRDNFLKLVNDGIYDSLLFHRVIQDFMIQGGDTKSKTAKTGEQLGSNDLPYQVPAEIHSELFHQKGALAAARTGNLQRASSSTQFYLVQGKIQNDSLIQHNQGRINSMLQRHFARNHPDNKSLIDSLELAREAKDTASFLSLSKKLDQVVAGFEDFEKYEIPEEHVKIYKSIGGTPHLDQNYTVFGQTISGLEVIDAIAAVETDERDRPIENVYILSMKRIPSQK